MNTVRVKKPDLGARSNPHVQKSGPKLWENRDATGDIKFKVDGNEISAHKCILASLSPKFERQFYGDFDDKDKQVIDVNEEGVTAAAFKEFLQFFYLDKVHLRHENIEGVLFLAKESLVEEFYDECVEYMREGLSIDNVCLSLNSALLHESKALIESCENLIRSKTMDVFATDGFINCSRLTLSNILQLVPQSCKTTNIFEACISWAKQYCAQNGMNEENNEHLRAAIGDVLYRINFGKMTIGEFMRYYKPYKSLFTDEERDEILSMIGGVSDFQPKWFVHSTKSKSSNNSVEVDAQSVWNWDERSSVWFGLPASNAMDVTMNSFSLFFSSKRLVLLRGFYLDINFPTSQHCNSINNTSQIYSHMDQTIPQPHHRTIPRNVGQIMPPGLSEIFATVTNLHITEIYDVGEKVVHSETRARHIVHRNVKLDSEFYMEPYAKYKLSVNTNQKLHSRAFVLRKPHKFDIVTIHPPRVTGIIGFELDYEVLKLKCEEILFH